MLNFEGNVDVNEDECEDHVGEGNISIRKPFECGACGAGFLNEVMFEKHIDLHG